MSETHVAPSREKRRYTPRQTNAERAMDKREALLESIPDPLTPELRARAARQAKRSDAPAPGVEMVLVKVTKRGDGRISTGQHVSGVGEVYFERGETFELPRHTAHIYAKDDELTDKAWVEIVGEVDEP